MSGGRFTIKVYAAGELVPSFEVFDAVAQGYRRDGPRRRLLLARQDGHGGHVRHRAVRMNAQETNGWLHYGGGLELWRELYAPFGVVPFAAGNSGTQMAGWFNKEIHSIDDIQGLKMRIPALARRYFNAPAVSRSRCQAARSLRPCKPAWWMPPSG